MKESWPEGAAWAQELARRLQDRVATYEKASAAALRRKNAAHMLAEVVKGLEVVPGITPAMLMPFKDLQIFVADLERGRRHPWSAPISVGGTNQESVAETELRIWTIIVAMVLIDAGFARKKAYQKIEAAAASTGREMPWRTIQRWLLECERGSDPRLDMVRQRFDQFWVQLECRHGGLAHRCPESGGGNCADIKDLPS
ncbi:MAG: hypothetical protein B7Z43_08730 [Sphingomonas sp. 12-62-6]|nr:MAG: hypothetical protein B7Z43_08730 [Sphingomonas sp. 12-62-6]